MKRNKILCPTLVTHTRGKIILQNHEEGDDMPWLSRWDRSSTWWLFESEEIWALNIRGVERFRSMDSYIKGWDWEDGK